MFAKEVSQSESYTSDSIRSDVQGKKKYKLSFLVIGKKGKPYSAYFAAIMLDATKRELGRQIRWINDFSGNQTNYDLIFMTEPKTKYLVLSYKMNHETPVKSNLELEFQDPYSLTLQESTEDHVSDDITKYEVPLLDSLTTKEEEILEKKMIWLCAPPRSGTTWLGTQLLNHKENIIWHEPWLGLHLGILRGTLVPGKDYEEKNYRFERVLDSQAKEGQYFFSPHHKNNWLPALRKLILARTYSHAQSLTKNIIIKDPVGSNGMDIISECLPNSKIIFLLRDGRDEVDSRMDMHRPDSWAKLRPFRNKEDRFGGIKYYSLLWVVNMKNVKKGFDRHNPKLRLMIKYEDLKEDTLTELGKIYNFLGVNISKQDLEKLVSLYDFTKIPESEKGKGKFTRSAKPGGWKNTFGKEEQELMNLIMGKKLIEFGYKI